MNKIEHDQKPPKSDIAVNLTVADINILGDVEIILKYSVIVCHPAGCF